MSRAAGAQGAQLGAQVGALAGAQSMMLQQTNSAAAQQTGALST